MATGKKKSERIIQLPPATVVLSIPTPERPYLVERLLTGHEVALEYKARQPELDAQFARARKVLKKWAPKLRKMPEYNDVPITGLSVRYRSKFGHPVSPLQMVIAINVGRKYSQSEMDRLGIKDQQLPSVMDGVPVKILEGSFELLSPQSAVLAASTSTKPNNPLGFGDALVGGAPIARPGHADDFGTLGVVQSVVGGTWEGLTANHVVTGNAVVEQVGPVAAGVSTTRPIGNVIRAKNSNHSHNGVTETLDCASLQLVQPFAGIPPSVFPPAGDGWIREVNAPNGALAGVPLFYSTRRVRQSDSAFKLWKFGAAMGQVIYGRVLDTDVPEFQIGSQRYRNNFTVENFSDSNNDFLLPGDSGSLLVAEALVNGNRAIVAIGILFARISNGLRVGLACNVSHVLDAITPTIPGERLIDLWDLPLED